MSDPILDPAAVESLRMINPDDGGEFMRELIDIFLTDTPERFAEIESALAAGNASDLSRAAHSIKGSSSNFGAARLAALAWEIERHGKNSAFDAVRAALPALRAEFDRVQPALEQLKATNA